MKIVKCNDYVEKLDNKFDSAGVSQMREFMFYCLVFVSVKLLTSDWDSRGKSVEQLRFSAK